MLTEKKKESAQGTGIRDALVNQYGVKNEDIGYQNGWVTVGGKNLVQPDWVSDSGTSYINDAGALQKALTNYYSKGDVGVRQTVGDFGLDSSKLGMKDGVVTYDGQNFLTPDRVQNGISYTDSRDDLMGAALNYYKKNGKNIVKATDYLANSGQPFAVDYNSGQVSIAGQTVTPLFVENGSAYIDSAEIDRAIRAAQNASGIQNRNDIAESYEDRYGSYYNKLLKNLTRRDAFSYDAQKDPSFLSYQEQYNREGDRAMRDALGAYSAQTGGFTNSAAMTAAGQQRQYYQDKLMDRLPELEQQAYQRYLNEIELDRAALEDVMALDNMQYGRAYGANSDLINDVRYNNQLNTARSDKTYERRLDAQTDPLTIASANHEVYGQALSNQSAEFQNLLTRSLYSGDWVDYGLARAFGIDPEKVKPRDYEDWVLRDQADIDYENTQRTLALKNAYT